MIRLAPWYFPRNVLLTDYLVHFRTDIREREFEEEEREELLGSDDEEQEDPFDYCKGELRVRVAESRDVGRGVREDAGGRVRSRVRPALERPS